MILFTQALLRKLPRIEETAEYDMEESIVYVKLFDCMGGSTWYIYAYNPETEEAMAFVRLNNDYQFAEIGYVSITELKEALGWRLERDRHFSPRKLSAIYDTVKAGGHV